MKMKGAGGGINGSNAINPTHMRREFTAAAGELVACAFQNSQSISKESNYFFQPSRPTDRARTETGGSLPRRIMGGSLWRRPLSIRDCEDGRDVTRRRSRAGNVRRRCDRPETIPKRIDGFDLAFCDPAAEDCRSFPRHLSTGISPRTAGKKRSQCGHRAELERRPGNHLRRQRISSHLRCLRRKVAE